MLERMLVLIPVTLLAVAQVILKWQAQTSGAGSTSRWDYLHALVLSPVTWAALLLIGGSFVVWMLLLQRFPLSYVYPAVSLSFPLVALLCHTLLDERIAAMQVLGLVLIVAGVALSAYYGLDAR